MRKRLFITLLACLCILSCSGETSEDLPEHLRGFDHLTVHPTVSEPEFALSLEVDGSFGESEDVIFGPIIRDIAVDETGRVYISDVLEGAIHVFDPDGSYLRNLGRRGQGPGEFQLITVLRTDQRRLHVLDHVRSIVSVFDLETFELAADYDISVGEDTLRKPGWLDRTRESGLFYKPFDFYVRPDGDYLVLFSDIETVMSDNNEGRTLEISHFNLSENRYIRHDLLSLEASREGILPSLPYEGKPYVSYLEEELIYGWTEDLSMLFYTADGSYQRGFYHHYSHAGIDLDDLFRRFGESRRVHIPDRNEIPDLWPAFDSFVADDEGQLWISTIVEDQDVYDWWIVNRENGEFVTKITLPRVEPIEVVKNGFVYTRKFNEMGEVTIVRYRIVV